MGKWVSYLNRERKLDSFTGRRPTAPPAPKGLYIYGNVGSGIFLNLIMFNSKENIHPTYHFYHSENNRFQCIQSPPL